MTTERVPPSDVAAERAVVAACLLAPDALSVARDSIQVDQFFDPVCRHVFEACCAVDDSGSRIDAVTLATSLRDRGRYDQIGGAVALSRLFEASPDLSHVSDHCDIVAAKARQRAIIGVCRTHLASAHGDVGAIDEYCAQVERDILAATDGGSREDAPQTIGELVRDAMPAIQARQAPGGARKRSGMPSGIRELDDHLWGGFDPYMYILAGRPGMGKTAFAGSVLLSVASSKKAGVLFSLEMDKEQLAMRLMSNHASVPFKTIRSGQMNQQEWDSFLQSAQYVQSLPISIYYKPGAHVSKIRTTLRREFLRLKREFNADPGMAVIDYAQLVQGNRPRGATREEEVGSVSRACAALPGEFKCPVMLLSQLNRAVETRPNKRPQLSDLRESGSLEQDGYGIMFLYRDDFYNPENGRPGEAEVIVAKNRNGETGTVNVRFDGACTRYVSLHQQMHDDLGDIDSALGGY